MDLKELISQGKSVQEGLQYVPPEGVFRNFKLYKLGDLNAYSQWKECSIRFLDIYYPDDKVRFVKYAEELENKHYAPQYLSNMIGVLVACEAMPSEKQKELDVVNSREADIKTVEDLEQTYLQYKGDVRNRRNSLEAIDAFHKWHAAACVLFDKWFYSTEEDLSKFQNIASGGNGYTLWSEYNFIYTPYRKLMERLREGREIKRYGSKTMHVKQTLESAGSQKKVNIFISYSHSEAKWLVILQKHLKVLEKFFENVETWDDTRLKGEDNWKKEIETAIEKANVAILLVSTDFLASDFISTDELPPLLRKAKENGTRILPLIVSPCDYDLSELEEFQAINSPEKTLADLKGDEAAIKRVFLSLTKEIRELI